MMIYDEISFRACKIRAMSLLETYERGAATDDDIEELLSRQTAMDEWRLAHPKKPSKWD